MSDLISDGGMDPRHELEAQLREQEEVQRRKQWAMTYVIEQRGDAYYLYSLVETNFGGVAKNFIRMASSEAELQKTIERLKNAGY
jgi:hypothetical protein